MASVAWSFCWQPWDKVPRRVGWSRFWLPRGPIFVGSLAVPNWEKSGETLFFLLGLEHRIQGGLGHWGVGVMMFPYASIPNQIHTWLCKRTWCKPSEANASAVEDVVWMVYKVGMWVLCLQTVWLRTGTYFHVGGLTSFSAFHGMMAQDDEQTSGCLEITSR